MVSFITHDDTKRIRIERSREIERLASLFESYGGTFSHSEEAGGVVLYADFAEWTEQVAVPIANAYSEFFATDDLVIRAFEKLKAVLGTE